MRGRYKKGSFGFMTLTLSRGLSYVIACDASIQERSCSPLISGTANDLRNVILPCVPSRRRVMVAIVRAGSH